MSRLRSVAWKRGRPLRIVLRVLLLLAGLAAVAPLLAVDPGVLALLLDVDLLALLGVVGLGLLRADARILASRLAHSLPSSWVRVGFELTRTSPRTLAP